MMVSVLRNAPSADGKGGRIFATPLARVLARGRGIALHALRGSGPRGRIVRADVENFAPPVPVSGPADVAADKAEPAVRAGLMQLGIDCRIDALEALRQQIATASGGAPPSLLDCLCRALALALAEEVGPGVGIRLFAPDDPARRGFVVLAAETLSPGAVGRLRAAGVEATHDGPAIATIEDAGDFDIATIVPALADGASLAMAAGRPQPAVVPGADRPQTALMLRVGASVDPAMMAPSVAMAVMAGIRARLQAPLVLFV